MKDRFKIKIWDKYDDEILNQFIEIIIRAFNTPATNVIKRKKKFLWYHKNNPAGESLIVYAEDETNGRIAAIRPLNKRRIIYNDITTFAYEATNAATDPDYQKKGLFNILNNSAIKILNERKAAYIFMFPNMYGPSRPQYLKIGVKDIGRFNMLIKPNYLNLLKKIDSIVFKRNFKSIFKPNYDLFDYKKISFKDLQNEKEHFELYQKLFQNLIHCERDLEYYKWRLVDHPEYIYEMVSNENIIAFILRGKRGDFYEIKISDLIFKKKCLDKKLALKEMFTLIFKKYNPDMLSSSLSTNHPYYKLFIESGFFNVPVNTRILRINLGGFPCDNKNLYPVFSNIDWDIE